LTRPLRIALLAALASGTALSAAAAVYNPETFTLSNGMRVVVIPNDRAPVVSHMVWYFAGAADEPRGKSGIAHYLEHLMFKGTAEVASGEFSRIVARNGGNENAFTHWDYTGYFQNVAVDRLELVMKLEADRMANLRLTDELVKPELQVVLEERRQRIENAPGARLGEELNAVMFHNHPYGIPIIGWPQEIEGLTRADAELFYKTWYAPNNAVLLVSGAMTAERLKPLAEATYGRIPAREVPARDWTVQPAQASEQRLTLKDEKAQTPSLSRQWVAPSYVWGAKEHAYALQVLAEVVGGGATSRLHRALVLEQRLATGIGMGYGPSSRGPATIGISGSPAPGVTVEQLEAGIQAVLDDIAKNGLTEAEIERAKTRMSIAAGYARDSLYGPARVFGTALAIGQTVEDVEAWPDRIRAVTPAAVKAAFDAVIAGRPSTVGVLLPADGATTGQSRVPAPAIQPVQETTR